MDDNLCEFFKESEFGESNINAGGDDLFAFLESLDGLPEFPPFTPLEETGSASYPKNADQEITTLPLVTQKSISSSAQNDSSEAEAEPEAETSPKSTKPKLASSEETNPDGQQKMSHFTVERNRRKQMNEHISLLRSLMPCFYVKRGDQASIIGGVVDYINELQQVLQSLEAKKQRKCMSDVLSPRIVSSPRPSPLSPRKPPLSPRPSPISPRIPPLSPRLKLPISPRTPQSDSPYKPRLHQGYLSPTASAPTTSTSSSDNINELVANSRSPVAQVEVKFSGPNLILKTVSPRIPGQTMKIISTLEDLSLEILNININTVEDIMLNSFTIKIGIECQLSAEELAHQIQQTFS